MKKIFLLAALACSVMFADAQNLIVGSYNIRNDNQGDARKGDGWATRYKILCDQVQWYGFDVFGTQEVKKNQLDDMLREMPEYASVGVGRDDGKEKGEFSPVLYKKDRFKLLDSGTFWLSEDPTAVGMLLFPVSALTYVFRTSRLRLSSGSSTCIWTTWVSRLAVRVLSSSSSRCWRCVATSPQS